MADKKISALPAATTPLTGAEVLPIVQGGATVQATNNDLRPKQIQSNATSGVLQVVGPANATTRVMTTPNANFTAARTDAAQTFTGNNTFNGTTFISAAEAYLGLDADTLGAGNLWYVISGGGGNVSPGYLSFFNGNGGNKVMTIAPSTTEQFVTDLSGNFNLVTGNVIIGTTAKGITTGSAIPLGFGVNNSVSAVTISTNSNLLVGTTVDAGALANLKEVTAGKFQTFSGATASLVNGATEDITGLVSGATYLVVCRGSANTTTFVIHTAYVNAAGGVTLATLSNGNGFVLTSPANNTLRVTSLVSTQTYPYTLTRIF